MRAVTRAALRAHKLQLERSAPFEFGNQRLRAAHQQRIVDHHATITFAVGGAQHLADGAVAKQAAFAVAKTDDIEFFPFNALLQQHRAAPLLDHLDKRGIEFVDVGHGARFIQTALDEHRAALRHAEPGSGFTRAAQVVRTACGRHRATGIFGQLHEARLVAQLHRRMRRQEAADAHRDQTVKRPGKQIHFGVEARHDHFQALALMNLGKACEVSFGASRWVRHGVDRVGRIAAGMHAALERVISQTNDARLRVDAADRGDHRAAGLRIFTAMQPADRDDGLVGVFVDQAKSGWGVVDGGHDVLLACDWV